MNLFVFVKYLNIKNILSFRYNNAILQCDFFMSDKIYSVSKDGMYFFLLILANKFKKTEVE